MADPGVTELRGRVAVVTGGHSGVGFYISEALLAEGMRVAILGRRADVLEQAAADLGGDVLAISCDIRDPDSVRGAFARVDEGLGPVGALVNNAAVISIYRVADATDEELHETIETNLLEQPPRPVEVDEPVAHEPTPPEPQVACFTYV